MAIRNSVENWPRWCLCIACLIVATCCGATLAQPTHYVEGIISGYSNFDYDGDGTNEINSIALLEFDDSYSDIGAGLVLVLVEERLLMELSALSPSVNALRNALWRFRKDLEDQGFVARFLLTDVYSGAKHQDGLTLLALRKMLQQVYYGDHFSFNCPQLEGVIFIGSFPEAVLVRTWPWQRTAGGTGPIIAGVQVGVGMQYFTGSAELIASRSEIVLADLDGNWASWYIKDPKTIQEFAAVVSSVTSGNWGDETLSFITSAYEWTEKTWEDFFWIQDLQYTTTHIDDYTLEVSIGPLLHMELTSADLAATNPVAMPEIHVSRVNARNVAVNPDPIFLSSTGQPIQVDGLQALDRGPRCFWHQDPALERELLIRYFNLNHAFRTGMFVTDQYGSLPSQSAALSATGLTAGWAANSLANNIPWVELGSIIEGATLLEYANWWLEPASIRWITAHSSPTYSGFPGTYDIAALETLASSQGGGLWLWESTCGKPTDCGGTPLPGSGICSYTPSFASLGGAASLNLHRSIYESAALQGSGASLLIHTGCDANSPLNETTLPYSDPHYADFQNMECLEFYMGCLAIISRAKGFNDSPLKVGATLGSDISVCFGEVWRQNFMETSKSTYLSAPTSWAASKKAYWWSVLGDWTLQLSDWDPDWRPEPER